MEYVSWVNYSVALFLTKRGIASSIGKQDFLMLLDTGSSDLVRPVSTHSFLCKSRLQTDYGLFSGFYPCLRRDVRCSGWYRRTVQSPTVRLYRSIRERRH